MSNKAANFERLAQRRVTEAIKKIRLIGNLSNRNNYDYEEQHVEQIIEALDGELKILRNRFKDYHQQKAYEFSFKDE